MKYILGCVLLFLVGCKDSVDVLPFANKSCSCHGGLSTFSHELNFNFTCKDGTSVSNGSYDEIKVFSEINCEEK